MALITAVHPIHEHDCPQCKFLGKDDEKRVDYYFCPIWNNFVVRNDGDRAMYRSISVSDFNGLVVRGHSNSYAFADYRVCAELAEGLGYVHKQQGHLQLTLNKA